MSALVDVWRIHFFSSTVQQAAPFLNYSGYIDFKLNLYSVQFEVNQFMIKWICGFIENNLIWFHHQKAIDQKKLEQLNWMNQLFDFFFV